jgi:hypothetical protein
MPQSQRDRDLSKPISSPWGRGLNPVSPTDSNAVTAAESLRASERAAAARKDAKPIATSRGSLAGGLSVADARARMIDAGEQPANMPHPVEHVSGEGFTGKIFYSAKDASWHAEVTLSDGSGYDYASSDRSAVLKQILTDIGNETATEAERVARRTPDLTCDVSDAINDPNLRRTTIEAMECQRFLKACPEFYPCSENMESLLGALHARSLPCTQANLLFCFDSLWDRFALIPRPVEVPVAAEPQEIVPEESETDRRERNRIIAQLRGMQVEIGTRGDLQAAPLEVLRDVLTAAKEELRDLKSIPLDELRRKVRMGFNQHRIPEPRI